MTMATAISIAPARATATLHLMREENVKLLFGSDTPSGDGGIGNPPGPKTAMLWSVSGVRLKQRPASEERTTVQTCNLRRGRFENAPGSKGLPPAFAVA